MARQPLPPLFSEKPWSVATCVEFDRVLQDLGLPAIVLMEQAARGISDFLKNQALAGSIPSKEPFFFVCGPGNNGADGIAAARQILAPPSLAPQVFLPFGPPRPGTLLAQQLQIYSQLGGPVHYGWEALGQALQQPAAVCVDALFGVGLNRPLPPAWEEVQKGPIQASSILAVDCPSGLDCDSGQAQGTVLPATWTLTFVAPKQGFSRARGPQLCGQVEVVDLGVSRRLASHWQQKGCFPEAAS